jgi:hypothetical protein
MAVSFEIKGSKDGRYPPEWPLIAYAIKCMAGWCCERCGVPHGPVPNVLTVHHLDFDKWNMQTWNLAALCQRCHLRVQALIPYGMFYQDWPFDHSPWMARHVAEYNEWAPSHGRPSLSLVGVRDRDYTHEWTARSKAE